MIRQISSFVFAIVSTVSVTAYVIDRDEVYSEGFKEGYSHAGKESSGMTPLEPLTPLTPLPTLGENTPSDTYNRAIIDGYLKYKKERGPFEFERD